MIIILLRGHIRNGFDNDELYNFIKHLNNLYTIEIYIHTWKMKQSSSSWNFGMKWDYTEITEDLIYSYFKDQSINIKHILIEDEFKANIIKPDNLSLFNHDKTNRFYAIPVTNSLYAQHNLVSTINEKYVDKSIRIINTRFDLLTHHYSIQGDIGIYKPNTLKNTYYFIEDSIDKADKHIVFFNRAKHDILKLLDTHYSNQIKQIDMCYLGTIDIMYKFLNEIYINYNVNINNIELHFPQIEYYYKYMNKKIFNIDSYDLHT